MKFRFFKTFLYLCILALFSCGGSDIEIHYLSLSTSSSDSFDISPLGSAKSFLMVPFSADSYAEGSGPSGQVAYSVDFEIENITTKISPRALAVYKDKKHVSLPNGWMERQKKRMAIEDFRHKRTLSSLQKVSDILTSKAFEEPEWVYKASSRTSDLDPSLALADEITVQYDIGEGTKYVTGQLRKSGSGIAIYTDELSSIPQASIDALYSSFANVGIKRVRGFWGQESDVDDNDNVIVMLSGNLGSNVLGFFQPWDLLPKDLEPDSNEMEILFSTYPGADPAIYAELIEATLVHEFFHLVNFSVKTLDKLLQNPSDYPYEDLFLNEGMAHLTEDITGFGYDAFATAAYFLDYADLSSVGGSVDPSVPTYGANPSDVNDTLSRRAAAMLFLRYLFERKGAAKYSTSDAGTVSGGGVDFLKRLNSSSYTGINNLERSYGDSFERMLRQWVATVYVDGTALSEDRKFNYNDEETDSFTAQKRGFDLRGTRTLPDSGHTVIDLDGPKITHTYSPVSDSDDISDSVFASGGAYYIVDLAADQGLKVTMNGSAGLGLGMTIVRLE